MVIGIRSLALTLVLSGGLAAPAAAEVIYSFEQTSYTPTTFTLTGQPQIVERASSSPSRAKIAS